MIDNLKQDDETKLNRVAEYLIAASIIFNSIEICDSDLSQMQERLSELKDDVSSRAYCELESVE